MPNIEVTLSEGRSSEQIRALIAAVHEAAMSTVATRPEHVRVVVREVPRTHWATGNRTIDETTPSRSNQSNEQLKEQS